MIRNFDLWNQNHKLILQRNYLAIYCVGSTNTWYRILLKLQPELRVKCAARLTMLPLNSKQKPLFYQSFNELKKQLAITFPRNDHIETYIYTHTHSIHNIPSTQESDAHPDTKLDPVGEIRATWYVKWCFPNQTNIKCGMESYVLLTELKRRRDNSRYHIYNNGDQNIMKA